MPSRIWLPCRRARIANCLQRLRAVAGLDFEIIELKQQFCGNRHTHTHTHTHTNQLSTVTLRPRGQGFNECMALRECRTLAFYAYHTAVNKKLIIVWEID